MTLRPQETACPHCCCIVPTRSICSHCGSRLAETDGVAEDGSAETPTEVAVRPEGVLSGLRRHRSDGRRVL